MFNNKKPEVIVAGAGPVGLFAALSLARRDVRVQIVEEEWRGTTKSYALALHPGSLELLGELGLAHDLLERSLRLQRVGFYDGTSRKAEIDLTKLSTEFPFLAIVPQSEIESVLTDALHRLHVEVQWNHRLALLEPSANAVDVTVDTLEKEAVGYAIAESVTLVEKSTTFHPAYLVGADGHESVARKQLGIRFESVRPAERFAVFEVEADGDLPAEACVIFHEDSSNVLWPMPKRRCRWSFQIPSPKSHRDTREKDRLLMGNGAHPELDQAALEELISRRAPWFKGEVGKVRWSTIVDFDYRLATAFGKERVWLIGDAAHMTGPVGAQSMNVGLREAAELAEVLAGILHGRTAPRALSTFAERSHAEWHALLNAGRPAIVPGPNAPAWLADKAERLLSAIPASGAHLGQVLEQLGFRAS